MIQFYLQRQNAKRILVVQELLELLKSRNPIIKRTFDQLAQHKDLLSQESTNKQMLIEIKQIRQDVQSEISYSQFMLSEEANFKQIKAQIRAIKSEIVKMMLPDNV